MKIQNLMTKKLKQKMKTKMNNKQIRLRRICRGSVRGFAPFLTLIYL